jgi:hypothetical protein
MKKLVLVGLVALVLIGTTMVAPLSGSEWLCNAYCGGDYVCSAGEGGGCISGKDFGGCLYSDGTMKIKLCGVRG